MLVYHGSYMEIKKADLNCSRHNLDFGKGFYVTTMREQADKWAVRKGRMSGKTPFVSVYELDVSGLRILTFEGYTVDWLDFVVKNRAEEQNWHGYDAVYGNIADDDVATVINDYMRLLKRGRMTENGKMFYLEQLQYSKPNNQYSIATQKGIEAMTFTESYTVEV